MLYTTQPTISRQIKLLEYELGVDLIDRKANHISLTPAGKLLSDKLAVAYEIINDGINQAIDSMKNLEGILRVGCLISLDVDSVLSASYRIFHKSYPGIQFFFEKHNFGTLTQKLKDREFDLIITLEARYNTVPGVQARHLFASGGVCLFSKNHPCAKSDNLSLSSFQDETIICLSDLASPRGLKGIKLICAKSNIKNKNILQVPNLESVFFYVLSGYGIALLDKSVRRIYSDEFMFIDTPCEEAVVNAVALWNEDDDNPVIQNFLDIVAKMVTDI